MKRLSFVLASMFICFFSVAQNNETPTPQWRPLYHFTPEKYWTNDPNGLIYMNGVYHLYNQQNPFENKWGHMSWGHATSTDLVHWKHMPVAMPEAITGDDTVWRFSGSAVWDKNNTSGFCTSPNCMVAIYTAHQPHIRKESQYIAYSNDGGNTYTNYQNNPVIDLNMLDFRDPNVFWYEPSKEWVMTVVLPAEHKARFYGSADLKKWNLLSEFGPQGYTGANWECPFLIQLPVEGTTTQKWVLVTSAAGGERGVFEQYFVGDWNGKEFKNDNRADVTLPLDYGDCFYAAIPWNNMPDNKKTYVGWMVPNPQETSPWKGQMSLPRDMSLVQTKQGFRLKQVPSSIAMTTIAKAANGKQNTSTSITVADGNQVLDIAKNIKGNAFYIKAQIIPKSNGVAGFKIAQTIGSDGKVSNETVIGYDDANHQVYVDRSHSGGGKVNEKRLKQVVDIEKNKKEVSLEIWLDKSSLEVFVNGGEQVITTYIYPDENSDGIAAFSTGGKATLKSVQIKDLSGMSQEDNQANAKATTIKTGK